jgi:hypothetical protein
MRSLCGLGCALLLSTGLFAQNHVGFVNFGGGITRGAGSVVFPAGTSSLPGVTRTTGSVANPGGAGQQILVPGTNVGNPNGFPGRIGPFAPGVGNGFNGNGFNNGFNNGINNGFKNGFNNGFNGRNRFDGKGNNNNGNIIAYPVPYPVYGGGGYGYDQPPMQQAPAQTPPNVIVVYPPAPAYSGYGAPGGPPPQSSMIEVPPVQEEPAASSSTATHYLIALKDHSIYSAVAYFVEGDTLHYFTTGNQRSQVKINLVDRDLTRRLNEDSGLEVKLPAAQ